MFLKKGLLPLKARLSITDILIQEYEDSVATEIKVTSSHSIEYLKSKIHWG
jgi:hypothetical protein